MTGLLAPLDVTKATLMMTKTTTDTDIFSMIESFSFLYLCYTVNIISVSLTIWNTQTIQHIKFSKKTATNSFHHLNRTRNTTKMYFHIIFYSKFSFISLFAKEAVINLYIFLSLTSLYILVDFILPWFLDIWNACLKFSHQHCVSKPIPNNSIDSLNCRKILNTSNISAL